MKKIIALLSFLVVLAGCQASQPTTNNTINVKVEILVQGKAVDSQAKTITVADKEDILDAMKANYDIKEEKGLIQSIAGIESDKGDNVGRWWKLLVNDEMATTGAADVQLKEGDKVTFDLTSDWN
ncbi:MAG: DUF4430 domain-containing protein [Aerococcaceae bacterium]|nr:DUF4430 domain-containing protein [Aerococcaceae bacterium]